jgi:hypothetical protein
MIISFQGWNFSSLVVPFYEQQMDIHSGCTHHMAKDASLFTSLNEAKERKIYVANDFALDIAI